MRDSKNEIIAIKLTSNFNEEENGASKKINVATWETSNEPRFFKPTRENILSANIGQMVNIFNI
jgi:hypothetical protein